MNQEPARNQETTSTDQIGATHSLRENTEESSELFAVAVQTNQDSYHISWLDNIPFSRKHFGSYYFKNGLIWGAIFGFTAILSASCGVALTKINAVEKMIARTINSNSLSSTTTNAPVLDRPVNILLVEVEPTDNKMLKFQQAFSGESKTILLLKFDPQSNIAQGIDIPADSRVKIPGLGWGTIADAHQYGNMVLVSQTVEKLLGDITIDRYVQGTPKTFQRLLASGKIYPQSCDLDCHNPDQQVERQQQTVAAIRQRLRIPTYLRSFEHTLMKTQADLDTNLSLPETMLVANYVKELPATGIEISLIPGYVPGKRSLTLKKSTPDQPQSSHQQSTPPKMAIAVQNTTNSPELAIRFLAYLRQQNFQDVYLVEHIPLRLNKTKIITNQSQYAQAAYLQDVLGFGRLQSRHQGTSQPVTIQIGEDARRLPLSQDLEHYQEQKY